jgi:hypothetical protein
MTAQTNHGFGKYCFARSHFEKPTSISKISYQPVQASEHGLYFLNVEINKRKSFL